VIDNILKTVFALAFGSAIVSLAVIVNIALWQVYPPLLAFSIPFFIALACGLAVVVREAA